jgi:hypothetical protein
MLHTRVWIAYGLRYHHQHRESFGGLDQSGPDHRVPLRA